MIVDSFDPSRASFLSVKTPSIAGNVKEGEERRTD